jgi:hypothetical protein
MQPAKALEIDSPSELLSILRVQRNVFSLI